eukprot:CAMPEP_0172684482 /NCGR_PEP_ID=MMETSP1074-20121228/19590_1 /TAXON_ID=2916 /ORGANISM="Ceratium fusus, Strain PA161109" /LENGTH=38 /DNA_ID= /DNA_START= /DNA_END= /DNA_ORIENTATION=
MDRDGLINFLRKTKTCGESGVPPTDDQDDHDKDHAEHD